MTFDSLFLQAAEEGFCNGIVPTVSPAAHAGYALLFVVVKTAIAVLCRKKQQLSFLRQRATTKQKREKHGSKLKSGSQTSLRARRGHNATCRLSLNQQSLTPVKLRAFERKGEHWLGYWGTPLTTHDERATVYGPVPGVVLE